MEGGGLGVGWGGEMQFSHKEVFTNVTAQETLLQIHICQPGCRRYVWKHRFNPLRQNRTLWHRVGRLQRDITTCFCLNFLTALREERKICETRKCTPWRYFWWGKNVHSVKDWKGLKRCPYLKILLLFKSLLCRGCLNNIQAPSFHSGGDANPNKQDIDRFPR